jgi:hypothetical protein
MYILTLRTDLPARSAWLRTAINLIPVGVDMRQTIGIVAMVAMFAICIGFAMFISKIQ